MPRRRRRSRSCSPPSSVTTRSSTWLGTQPLRRCRPTEAGGVDRLLVTHEHGDHNGIEAVAGEPVVLRSTAGRLESPIGEVLAIASEHDDAAGTERGPNTIFAFDLDGVRVVHFG